jgi:hypothetical protein
MGHLQLSEQMRWELPTDYSIAGAALSESGTWVAWSSAAPVVYVGLPDGKLVPIGIGRDRRPLAAVFRDSIVEILDGATAQNLKWSIDGELIDSVGIDIEGRSSGAHFLASGPVVLSVSDSTAVPYLLTDFAGTRAPHNWSRMLGADGSNTVLRIGGSDRCVSVATANPPFRAVLVCDDSNVVELGAPSQLAGARTIRDDGGLERDWWVGLQVIVLDSGLSAQTLADIRSGDRQTVFRSADGSVVAVRTSDVPLTLISAHAEKRRLLADFKYGKHFILLYGWRWEQ